MKYETINREEFEALMSGTKLEDLRQETTTSVELSSTPPPVPPATTVIEDVADDVSPQAE